MNQREIIRKHTDIGEHFTREISLEYHIYFLPLGGSMQKTNPVLPTTHGLQDKIVRYGQYRENSFISVPLTYGKCVVIILRGYLEKRHLRECFNPGTINPTLPSDETWITETRGDCHFHPMLPQIRPDREYLRAFLAQAPHLRYE
jgi:hypothetical protein